MNLSPQTRFSLIEKIKNPADIQAWGEFVEIYEPLIVEACRRKGLQHADAVDVAQEVLTRVAANIATFKYDQPQATFRGWLYRITRNLTIDFIRQRTREPLEQFEMIVELDRLPDPEPDESIEFEQAYQQRLFLHVAQIVESDVQPQTWAAFWRIEVEGQNPAQVAEELGMTRGAVYVAKSRIIARLRREVQKRLSETTEAAAIAGDPPE